MYNVYAMHVYKCLGRPEEGIGAPELVGWEPPCKCWEPNLDRLQEQPVL